MPDSNWSLVCPFLTDDPNFARGVEFGLLFAQMKTAKAIDGYYLLANQEQITLLANRAGWTILKMKAWDKSWFRLKMRKGE